MKATLEFDLPDEEYIFQCAQSGAWLVSTLHDIDNTARSVLKHGGDAVEALERIRSMIAEERLPE